jgi:hypothetical protein
MTMHNTRALEEARIRTAIDDRANTLRAKGVHGLACPRAAAFRGAVGCEIHDLSITADDDEALCEGLLRISGSRPAGDRIDVWAPATFCLRKVDGAWEVTDERTPLPFTMDGRAKAPVQAAARC